MPSNGDFQYLTGDTSNGSKVTGSTRWISEVILHAGGRGVDGEIKIYCCIFCLFVRLGSGFRNNVLAYEIQP